MFPSRKDLAVVVRHAGHRGHAPGRRTAILLSLLVVSLSAQAQDLPQSELLVPESGIVLPGHIGALDRPQDLVPSRALLPELTLLGVHFNQPCDPHSSTELYFDLHVAVTDVGSYPIYFGATLSFHDSDNRTLRNSATYPQFTAADFDPIARLYSREVRGYIFVNQVPRDLYSIIAYVDPSNIITEFDETNNTIQVSARELFADCPV